MRKLLSLVTAALLLVAFGLAGVSQAAPLKWSGTLTVDLGAGPGTAALGTGVATLNGSAGGAHLNTLFLSGGFGTPNATATDVAPGVTAISASLSGPTGTAFGGPATANFSGVLVLNIAGGAPIVVPATSAIGVAGTAVGSNGTTNVTLMGAGWSSSFAHGPASGTSSTATRSGVIKLVTATQVSTNLAPPNDADSFVTAMKLHFVPEPGMLLLLGSGVVGLVLIGRKRFQR